MKDSLMKVVVNFKSFIGTGWLMWVAFCIALLFCMFVFKEKRKKLFTPSVIGCLIILNPLVYRIVGDRFMSGVYWRLFWILPIVITVAAVLTEQVWKLKRMD